MPFSNIPLPAIPALSAQPQWCRCINEKTASALITLARKGYHNQMYFDAQFNLMYIYSAKTSMPVYYRLLPGNIREVRAYKN